MNITELRPRGGRKGKGAITGFLLKNGIIKKGSRRKNSGFSRRLGKYLSKDVGRGGESGTMGRNC